MTKPPIVILHGWALTGDTFQPLVEALQKRGYRVFSLDFPGFGNAELPDRPWSLADYAKWLNSYLEKHNIKNPLLFGHSFGGRVALKFEQLFPCQSTALILSGTPGYAPVSRFRMIVGLMFTKLGAALFRLPPFFLFEERARLLWYRIIGAKDFLRPQKVMRDTFKKIITESLVEPMRSVSCPCLLLWGEGDRIVPVSVSKRMGKTIPGAKLIIISGARHGVPFRKPEKVAQVLEDYVVSLPTGVKTT